MKYGSIFLDKRSNEFIVRVQTYFFPLVDHVMLSDDSED